MESSLLTLGQSSPTLVIYNARHRIRNSAVLLWPLAISGISIAAVAEHDRQELNLMGGWEAVSGTWIHPQGAEPMSSSRVDIVDYPESKESDDSAAWKALDKAEDSAISRSCSMSRSSKQAAIPQPLRGKANVQRV